MAGYRSVLNLATEAFVEPDINILFYRPNAESKLEPIFKQAVHLTSYQVSLIFESEVYDTLDRLRKRLEDLSIHYKLEIFGDPGYPPDVIEFTPAQERTDLL